MEFIYLISGVLLCEVVSYTSKYTFSLNQKYLSSFPPNFLMQLYFGICSLILISIFGYTLNFKISLMDLWKILYQSFFLFSISALIINSIIDTIESSVSNNMSEVPSSNDFIGKNVNKQLFMFMVLFINPVTEELLYRGFLLNHILSLDYITINTKVLTISLPVLISGFYFGFIHRSLLKMDMDKFFVYKVMIKGAIVGIACGYFYIEYNSFTAAIVVHFIANIAENISTSLFNSLSSIFYNKVFRK